MRSHEMRLRKLEARMSPPPKYAPALFVFGRDLDDVAARSTAEKQAGRVPAASVLPSGGLARS